MYTQAQIAAHKANGQFECCKNKTGECFETCQYLNDWMNAPTSLPSAPTWFKPMMFSQFLEQFYSPALGYGICVIRESESYGFAKALPIPCPPAEPPEIQHDLEYARVKLMEDRQADRYTYHTF